MLKKLSLAWKEPNKRRHLIISIVIFILAEIVMGQFYKTGGAFGYIRFGYANFAFYNLPFILLTGLYGIIPSVFMLLGLFIYSLITNIQEAYLFFPCLIAAFAIYLPARYRWFRRPSLCVFTVAILAFTFGNGYFFTMAVANPIGFFYVSSFGQLALLLSELPECILGVVLLAIFYNGTPEELRSEFACAKYYSVEYDRKLVMGKTEKNSALGTHVLLCLVIEMMILVISSISISITLFDIYSVSAGASETALLSNEVDTSGWKQRVAQDIKNGSKEMQAIDASSITIPEMRFISHVRQSYLNGMPPDITGKSMLRQLSMMLIMIIVPLLIISNGILQYYVIRPITNMEKFMTGYVATEETRRKEYIEQSPDITPVIRNSELYQLHGALKTLVENVEEYVSTIQRQRTVEDNLRIQQLAAEAKSSFLANMSKQIRSPINSIIGMNTMIMNSTQEVETKAFSKDIRDSAKTLMGVINDILDYSQIESGMLKIIPVSYDLQTTIRTVNDMVSSAAAEKELQLTYDIDPKLPSLLRGDEIRIRQCLLNIMNNAVKFTKSGGVTFSVSCEKAGFQEVYLKFSIKDTGGGMSEEKVQRVLEASLGKDAALNYSGEGLGMSIVNYLLDSMGSRLHMRSTLGQGTEVYFKILQKVEEWAPAEPVHLDKQ
ncbi:MAG: hypothetical protein IJK17_01745 [Lachnospiraceae bacterium]|nr:hypothetical protein [Lachnospiraceae bacterium]